VARTGRPSVDGHPVRELQLHVGTDMMDLERAVNHRAFPERLPFGHVDDEEASHG
jgi:hypothetical protein